MTRATKTYVLTALAAGLFLASAAFAQTTLPAVNAGFDITGFIEAATLSPTPRPGVAPELRGGAIRVNGKVIIVPDNTLVQFPASTWTWPQLFDPTAWQPVYDASIIPPPARPIPPANRTGLALQDPLVNHFPSYEVRVVGNIINRPATGTQLYVAGLIVPVAQQGMNAQSGYINYIDYATGRFRVGGTMNDPLSGTLLEINDPVGRFGLIHSPDQRFAADTTNPTITTSTGYPVCIPRFAPGVKLDPLCPVTNRPLNGNPAYPVDPFLPAGAPLKTFTMPSAASAGLVTPDPYKQVPLMVGDWVDFAGTLFKINPTGATSAANEYISVHSLTAHLGIKTTPGTNPAYLRVEGFLFGVGDGVGGPTVTAGTPPTPVVQETSTRVQLVAFTTNSNDNGVGLPTGTLFGIDVQPDGTEILRQFPNGTGVNIVIDDPIRGRMRWQTSKNRQGAGGNAVGPGKFYREYILKLSTGQTPNVANGLTAGQYRMPIFEYIFGEGTVFGQPWPPYNFNDFGFLAIGSGPLGPGGPNIGPLKPFPAFQ